MCDCFKKAPKGGSMHEDSDLHNRNTKIASALRVCGSFFITCVSRRLFNPRISKRPQTHRICSIPYIFLTLEFSLTAANHAATCEHCTLRAFVLKWITAQREMTWGCWYFRRVKANQWGGEINTGGETVTDDLNKVWSRPQPREEPGCLILSGTATCNRHRRLLCRGEPRTGGRPDTSFGKRWLSETCFCTRLIYWSW